MLSVSQRLRTPEAPCASAMSVESGEKDAERIGRERYVQLERDDQKTAGKLLLGHSQNSMAYDRMRLVVSMHFCLYP